MSERKIITKVDHLLDNYPRVMGKTHTIRKLVEEMAELSQVCMKILDKAENREEVPWDLTEKFWEELAHVHLFFGMAKTTMSNSTLMHGFYTERTNRLINKIALKMTDLHFPARVILMEPEQAPQTLAMPYERIGNEVFCYLTTEQYTQQLKAANDLWRGVNGEPAWFDDEYYESKLKLKTDGED